MPLNATALGEPIGPLRHSYTWKDVVLYALGVGAGFGDIDFCYEKNLKVIPSFAIAAIFEFLAHMGVKSGMNLAGILHGEQELVFHRPLPSQATLVTEGRLTHYYDKGRDKGALVVGTSDTRDEEGRRLFSSEMTIFARLDGGFNGPPAPKTDIDFPQRAPDFEVPAHPGADQPLLYRLSGDLFPLHVDADFAQLAGFPRPIMHGLCTHGFACRALMASLVPGRPDRVRSMDCRFTKPLFPGVPICTQIWRTGDTRALWRVLTVDSGDVIIDRGRFSWGEP
jgi:acyl dehydratase